MRIGIDARTLTNPFSGIGRYVFEFSKAIFLLGHEVLLYLPDQPHMSVPSLEWGTLRQAKFRTSVARFGWEHTILPYLSVRDKIDVLWGPSHRLPLIIPNQIVSAVTIHDLVWKRASHTMRRRTFYGERFFMGAAVHAADVVFVDSEATKRDLISIYPSCERNTFVIYPGAPLPQKVITSHIRNRLDLQGNYLLFVGTDEPRKNLPAVLRAWKTLSHEERHGSKLVICGAQGWGGNELLSYVHANDLSSDVIITGFVTEMELAELYAHSKGVLLPSLYEGFGFPIVEAHAYGIPVLTSNISSMPEIAGPDAILVNPFSVYDIKQGLLKILAIGSSPIDRQHRKEHARNFNWKRSAVQICEALTVARERKQR